MVRNQLYTNGGEFTLPDGSNYIGPYHVHIDKGAMVGALHKTEAHDLLTPVNAAVILKIQNIILELSKRRTRTSRSSLSINSVRSSSRSSGY
tara:strand:+ start:367 stop:642 length:276 start_codon:yes stop_codon:yes gene_type:complete